VSFVLTIGFGLVLGFLFGAAVGAECDIFDLEAASGEVER
jgi:hypothetical protein